MATTFLALIRGINVGGYKQVAMADLRELMSRLGFGNPRSLLQSGNLVFDCRPARSTEAVERLLEAESLKRLGLDATFLVRTAEEWKGVIARNPFPKEAEADPGHFLVQFLKDAPSATDVKALQAAITGRELLRVHGREAYVIYPDGVGKSRLTNTLLERKLATRATGRNWNTVLKLGALVEA
jgi:uncharacterized protein (DUF1697 family)